MKHGGNIREAELRYGHAQGSMLDLSSGICPHAYPLALDNEAQTYLKTLPQSEDIEAVKSALDLPEGAEVSLAPGSQILINLLPLLASLRKSQKVFIPEPAYSDHVNSWQQHGYEIKRYQAGELSADFSGGNLVVVQPGNPLGEIVAQETLIAITEQLTNGALLVVDEAFADLTPEASMLAYTGQRGLVVLRSFGKFYGLAGLRLGFAVGHSEDIAMLDSLLGEWSVSGLALRVGASALADKGFQREQREWISARHKEMLGLFERHGLEVIGGTNLFTLIATEDAAALHEYLAQCGIWTRIFSGKRDWLRIGLADEEGQSRLNEALASWQAQ